MNKNDLQELCDWDLIEMYQKGDSSIKKSVLECFYLRYNLLIKKMSFKYITRCDVNGSEDFEQEAFLLLVKTLDSVKLERVDKNWMIVGIYKLRMQRFISLQIKKEARNTNHYRHIEVNKNRNIVLTVNKCLPFQNTDSYERYSSITDFIQHTCGDNRMSEEEYLHRFNTMINFAQSVRLKWFYPFIESLLKGHSIDEACAQVGISRTRVYQANEGYVSLPMRDSNNIIIKGKYEKYAKHKKYSLKEKYKQYAEHIY